MNTPEVTEANFIDRRSFLRSCIGAGLGVGLSATVRIPLNIELSEKVTELTGVETGNASLHQFIKDECETAVDSEYCEEHWEPSLGMQLNSEVVGPILEEYFFRVIPSGYLDKWEDKEAEHSDIVNEGTEPFHFTRKEAVVGAISSLIFGLGHNWTGRGIDTKTIPASQTASGFFYWYLMRRFGVAASITAHSAYNYRAFHQ